MGRIDGNLHIGGRLTADAMTIPDDAVTANSIHDDAEILRSQLIQEPLAEFVIRLTAFRVWDALQTNLPGTSATDDLGLIGGTFGTNSPKLKTYDVKAAGAVTLRARVLVQLPVEYEAGQTVNIRLRCEMETTVADVSATVDVEAYQSNDNGGISADLCATAAQSINSLTDANKDFVITPTTLAPGDWLDVRVTIAVNDAATATAVLATIGNASLLCDIRG